MRFEVSTAASELSKAAKYPKEWLLREIEDE